MKKRILSMLLVIVMVLSLVPVSALADGEALTIEPEFLNVIAGDPAVQLSAKKAGTLVTAGWTTEPSASEIATISSDGKLTGLKQGEIKVVARDAVTNDFGTKTYKVYQPPVELKLVKKDTTEAPAGTMKVGESVQLGYTCTNKSEILPEYIVTGWSIRRADNVNVESNEGILDVDATGKLTAKKVGKATVRLAMNGRSVTQTIEVLPADPGKITIDKSAESVKVNETVTLTVSIGDNASIPGKDYTFSVDPTSEGNVSFSRRETTNTCAVTGTKAGKVKINVTKTVDDKSYAGSIELNVDPLSEMSITAASDKMFTNRTLTLTASVEGVKWSSGDTSVATVNETTGEVRSYSTLGPVTIKAEKDGYKDATYVITVVQNSFRITDASGRELKETEELKYGQTIELQVWDKSETAQSEFTFEVVSPAPEGISVTTDGKLVVNPKTATTFEVKATKSGTTVTQKFSVSMNSMTIKDQKGNEVVGEISLYKGDTMQLTAFDGEKALSCNWTSRNTNKFTATNGELIGLELTDEGQPVELVVDFLGDGYDRVTFQVKVLAKKPLTNVTLDDTKDSPVEVRVGQPKELAAVLSALHLAFEPADATHKDIKWTSDNACLTVENVDGKDMLTAHAFGSATVTGTYETAEGPKTVTFKVRTFAANGIEVDPNMPKELICGESMDLKAVLKDAEGKILDTPVQWRLKNDKVIKNLVDLTANKLTAYPQSTYDFDVYLEAYIEGNDQVEVVEVPIHVIPRTTNIALKKGEEDISDKTIVLNVNDPAGIQIDAVIKPSDASKVVDWQINGPSDIYNITRGDSSIVIKPVSSQKTGAITVIATAKDGTGISRQTRIEFAKMADTVVITNAPGMMRGGANIQLRTNLDEDKTITDRRVKWSVPEEFKQLASVTEDGFLDTAKVTDQQTIKVKATLIANPEKYGEAVITLCPAVKTIKVMQKVVDEAGKQVLVNVRNVVDYSEKTIELDQIAYPAGHTGSFVWDSSNKNVADFEAETSVLVLKGAGKTQITCTATDGSGARGIYNLEVVKSAGDVVIDGADELISGKNTTLKATVYTDDGVTLAANQKVTWSVEDVYGNPTKAATINSRGRLYAKTVNYGTEVVVYATSVENKEVIGEWHVNILPKKEKSFAAFLEDDDRIIEAPVYMNTNETAVISGRWYYRDINDFIGEEDCLFFSSNPAVATIDQNDGMLETKKNGSTTITVRATDPDTRNVYTAKFTLHVVNTVDHIVISKPNNTPNYVRSGSYMNLSATVWSNVIETIKADNQGVTWGVYEEDGDELVATKAAYMTSNGALVAYSVTENTPVVVVATSKENPSITAELPMTIRPASAYTITARCMDEDSGDMVVPTGAVNLEVMPENTPFSTEIDVKVYVSDPNSAYDNQNLPGAAIVWETSNKDIVKVVDGKLYYTGRTGKVKVTPTFKAGNVTYRGNAVTLNIMKFVDSIEVTKKYANQELYSGKSLVMYAIVDEYATTRRVTWSLIGEGDSEVASINPTTGLIRAKKGLTKQVDITVQAMATDGSGETGELDVTIYPLATKVAITSTFKTIKVGDDEKQVTAKVFPFTEKDGEQLGANQEVKWSSSRSSVLAVDEDGNLTAKRRGTATIKAKATDGSGKYATIKITVVNP